MNTSGGMKRMLGGMPHVLSVAHGPGRIAFSRDAAGEVVVLPLHPSHGDSTCASTPSWPGRTR